MGPLVASSVHIPEILSQNALNRQTYHTVTEVLEVAHIVILMVNLDVSNHTGAQESIAGHDVTELATLVYV
jgi:hypothetical protein